LIKGAGFAGLELAIALSAEFGEGHEVTLIDKGEGFVFGFSKLDVMFGKSTLSSVFHPYRDIDKPGLNFVRATIDAIDPVARRVETDAGPFEGDIPVVALGADLDPGVTPGLVEGAPSTTRWPAHSPCVTNWPRFRGARWSSESPPPSSSARQLRARPPS
jgi:sulfide:quinone oxidoreductase